MPTFFSYPTTELNGIGDKYDQLLHKLSIYTVSDLVKHYPNRYLDLHQPTPIYEIKPNQTVCLFATISQPKTFYSHNRKLITNATATNQSGKLELVWFNSPYISRSIKLNTEYFIYGKTSFFGHKICIVSPTIEVNTDIEKQGKILPIYPQTAGISSKWLRSKIKQAIKETPPDPISSSIIKTSKLISLKSAYQEIHFPSDMNLQKQADKRLSFNEHLLINLKNQIELVNLPPSPAVAINRQTHEEGIKHLPFKLTQDQLNAISKLYQDIQTTKFTHRLIQGETGSGKTVLLVLASNQCLQSGLSVAIMAPTQILAQQHALTFQKLGLYPQNIKLITGTTRAKVDSSPTIYIGTQSLIHQLPPGIKPSIALIAIDEQHKFGVEDRQSLIQRQPTPHLVNLSATPIPRTMALGLFGEIKTSNLKSRKSSKKKVKTWLLTPDHYDKSHQWIVDNLQNGQKMFVVCPLIQTSSKLSAHSTDKVYEQYQKKYHHISKVFKLHGQMSQETKNDVITKFKQAESAILVSTSIIEVGIDIPEANIIIIHSAERFGLAQLHQLRGRVGRGKDQGYCLLVPSTDDSTETERLQLLCRYQKGITLAKMDLKLRGAGELFGLKQHGHLPTKLKSFWSQKSFQNAKKVAQKLVWQSLSSANRLVSELENC